MSRSSSDPGPSGASLTHALEGAEAERARIAMAQAAAAACGSSCLRSRCGAIILDAAGILIGQGHNSPPGDVPLSACRKDGLPADFRSDRTCCLHAEERAIVAALRAAPERLAGGSLYFIRLDAQGAPQPAGAPYCTMAFGRIQHAVGLDAIET
jgi:deoxycytidylate deaminase